jgi:hypothetical protein
MQLVHAIMLEEKPPIGDQAIALHRLRRKLAQRGTKDKTKDLNYTTP